MSHDISKPKRNRIRRNAALFALLTLAVLAVAGLRAFVSIDNLRGCHSTPGDGTCAKADAIVVVSGGDTAARTNEAVKLYKNGWASLLIVSGAAKDISGPSNAQAMKDQAVAGGVPENAILIDEAARDTNENASGAAELARQRGANEIIVVTSPYHMARALVIFSREFPGVGSVRGHPSVIDNNWPDNWWATPRGWWLVGGELIKITVEVGRGTMQRG